MENFLQTKKGVFVLNIVKYLSFFLCMCLFSIASIKGQIFPFSAGFYLALCWCDQNIFLVGLIYVVAGLCTGFSPNNLFSLLFALFVVTVCFLLHKKTKVRIPLYILPIYFVLSQVLRSYFSFFDISDLVPIFVSMFLGILFMFACIDIFKILLVKKIGIKLTIDEQICLATFFVAIGAGLCAVDFFGFPLVNIFCAFGLLCSTYIFSSRSIPLVFAVSLGLGVALQTGSLMSVATFVSLATACIAFKSTGKYFSVMAMVICDVVLGLYFDGYANYTYKVLICTMIGEILFLCISNKNLGLLKTVFYQKDSQNAIREMVNRSRDNLCKRMYSLSEVFDEMDRAFKSTVRGTLPANDAKIMLKDEVYQKICADCPQKHHCHRVTQKQTEETFDSIISAGIDRGKVTLLDIPPIFGTKCARTNTILSFLNQLLVGYKQYTYCSTSMDMSRALVADEFGGVAKLLVKLADDTKQLVSFDKELEQKIADDLNYINVMASEIYCYDRQDKSIECTITMRAQDLKNAKLFDVLDKNFGAKMQLLHSEPAQMPNFVVATFAVSPKYDCIFGSSGVCKFGFSVSGDSYSFIRINPTKVLISICDGMGSGEEAQKTSDTTISLIENFYRADFDNETILSSVNRLLSMEMSETYSAVDIVTLDLSNANADFIKVGAPACFVKHAESTEKIESLGALPVGILETIQPSISKKVLSDGDIIILMSDGIIDAFESDDKLQTFINNLTTQNPQEICDIILKEAQAKEDNQAKDDMTIVATRLFSNI